MEAYFDPRQPGSFGGVETLGDTLKVMLKVKMLELGCRTKMHIHYINLLD